MPRWIGVFLLVAAPAAAQEAKPSFDRAKARSPAEKLICSDSGLAQLDRELSFIYRIALYAGIVDAASQNAWIRRRDAGCVSRDARECLRARMQARIAALGGRNPSFANHTARIPRSPLPSPAEAREACNSVALRGPAIALELIGSGVLDANNDGHPDEVNVGVNIGTMRDDTLEFRPTGAAKDSEPIEITLDGSDDRKFWGFGVRWFRHGGRTYTLHFESETLRRATYLGYIDAENVEHAVCEFSNIEREELKAVTKGAVELCTRVAGRQVNEVPASEEQNQATGRRETGLKGRASVDFRDVGRPEPLLLLSYGSGAGRGCGFDYFDVSSDGRNASAGEDHDILMTLQEVEPYEGRSFGPCGNGAPHWFEYRGRIYLEYASDEDHGLMTRFHKVASVSDRQIEVHCKGEFKVRWAIKTMGRRFK
jgi:uncharacterized protein